MSGDARAIVQGEELWLLPERAAYWPAQATLFVADAHFGKAAAFRAAAIPVPEATSTAAIARLERALNRTGAGRIVFLGDLLHAASGRIPSMMEEVRKWRESRANLPMLLIRGNHDLRAGDPPEDWNIDCVDEPWIEPPFALVHQPCEPPAGLYALGGHVHPSVVVADRRVSYQFPCFHFGPRCGLLPAFGEFSGMAVLRPRQGDGVYIVAGDAVIEKARRS